MKLVRIFSPPNKSHEGLFAIKYDGDKKNCFEDLFEEWADPQAIFTFCKLCLPDIKKVFNESITPAQAANFIMDEAEDLEKQILCAAIRNEMGYNLQSIFKPLDNRVYELKILQESKSSIKNHIHRNPKLRIYALRIAPCTYIVTGGAIKLTDLMSERAHTARELEKLKAVIAWLKKKEIIEAEDILELL